MSGHTKARHTKRPTYVNIWIEIPGGKEKSYHIPSFEMKKLDTFLKKMDVPESDITPWEEATPWEVLAKDRIAKYKKAGLVLRGARYRENVSQVQLAKMSGVHQNEISKIENGKRGVGQKVAKKLAKPLKIDYHLLLQDDS
jgi:ribosome-binding protein aMBF1 (putative translation factor)